MMPSHFTPEIAVLLALLGFAVGTFGTLVGAGGGFILTPVLLLAYPKSTPALITAISLSSPTATLKSKAGGIDATFSAAPSSVHASTNVGPITLAVPGSAAYQIDTHAYVGSSTVTVPKNPASPHVISASSDLGSITISPS